MKTASFHLPVLLEESLELLQVQPGGRYIDCTVGSGGHAALILERSSPGGQLLGIDVDPEAIKIARERLEPYGKAVVLVNENFKNLEAICQRYKFHPVHGILFDLGISSLQLEDAKRGFSFKLDAPLDMRFSPVQELTAANIVNVFPEPKIVHLLKVYADERKSRQIARQIVQNRPITSTLQLAKVVEKAVGKNRSKIHPATRTFQALRMAVNQELDCLKLALEQAVNLLGFGGRLVIISYHSLEDRLVKAFLKQESYGHSPTLRLLTKKIVTPSAGEVKANPRSRSARMRTAERL